jgi:uncharacterized protein (DUF1499 family)
MWSAETRTVVSTTVEPANSAVELIKEHVEHGRTYGGVDSCGTSWACPNGPSCVLGSNDAKISNADVKFPSR